MITKIKSFTIILLAVITGFTSCKKTSYQLGDLKAPADLALTATVAGVDAANPGGNGSGSVQITATAANVITYNIDFGDGTCDDQAVVTVNGRSRTITLRHRR